MEIQSTTNYEKFKIVKSNREVSDSHVKKITESIRERDLLMANPIIVNEKMEVIDGQHRLAAAKALKRKIYYMVVEGLTDNDISRLNANKSNWALLDYLNYYCIKGEPEYKKLRNFIVKHPKFSITAAVHILCEYSRGITLDFKEGKFVVDDEQKSNEIVAQIEELGQFGKHVYGNNFLRAFTQISRDPKYDHKKMIHQISKSPREFVPCGKLSQYFDVFNEIFNRDIRQNNRVTFNLK
ncbi:ParB N-terminal domain-containing protein [Parasegetibacter sp. NRK P23]|uniref:ParB N-terminal domain-containing protein n=1 Tax=Parasegetibacter sp. NRK P23 TaxID=2942999 RepID=UPI0020447389|nr:ParB N-terminal domain-containing protein [Parasegetibacter sp. NRK P23]MCM5528950.1 ParB N-terminal domain-containing protein [Parasegetibacter sp. NRK P23]